MKNKVHIEGFINCSDPEDGVYLRDSHDDYIGKLLRAIDEQLPDTVERPKTELLDRQLGGVSFQLNECRAIYYISDRAEALEDVKKKHLEKLLGGDMEGLGENYGYSELTIFGMTQELLIGGHDLHEELMTYVGKYLHLIIEY